jgi:hypothetical protein
LRQSFLAYMADFASWAAGNYGSTSLCNNKPRRKWNRNKCRASALSFPRTMTSANISTRTKKKRTDKSALEASSSRSESFEIWLPWSRAWLQSRNCDLDYSRLQLQNAGTEVQAQVTGRSTDEKRKCFSCKWIVSSGTYRFSLFDRILVVAYSRLQLQNAGTEVQAQVTGRSTDEKIVFYRNSKWIV